MQSYDEGKGFVLQITQIAQSNAEKVKLLILNFKF
jgi:hypothetical protein